MFPTRLICVHSPATPMNRQQFPYTFPAMDRRPIGRRLNTCRPPRSGRRVVPAIAGTVRGGGERGKALRGLAGTPLGLVQSIDCTVPGRRMQTLQFSRLELIRAWTQRNRQYTTVAAGPQPGDLCSSPRDFPQRTRHPAGLKHSAHSAHCRRRIRRRQKRGWV